MTKKQYNIIWGDDKVNSILENQQELFKDNGINVIAVAKNAKDLEEILKNRTSEIDAVVTDANYHVDNNKDIDDPAYESELDISGVLRVVVFMEEYKDKIPFFLCTARTSEILRPASHEMLNYFYENEHIFYKNRSNCYEELVEKIIEEVDKMSTPNFLIRNRYHKELEIADSIDYEYEVNGRTYKSNAGKDILKWLVDDYKGILCDTHLYFNPLRKILEELQTYLSVSSIIPSYISLKDFAKFCKHKQGELVSQTDYVEINGNRIAIQRYYALSKNLRSWAHPTLMRIFSYLLDTTQDASHRSATLSWKFDEYTRAHKNRCHVFHSVLHSMLEILNWCHEIVKSPQFKNHWYGDLYGETVDIQDDSGNWFVDKILLKPANVECMADINEPVTIGVVTKNKDPETKEKYPLFFPMPGLIGVVKKDRNGLFVYDSIVCQDDIQEGDKVKIINSTPEYCRSGDNKRVVTVEKIEEETLVAENDNSGENTTNETTPPIPDGNVVNTDCCIKNSEGKELLQDANVVTSEVSSADNTLIGTVELDNEVYHIGEDMWFHAKKNIEVGDKVEILKKMDNTSPLPERMKYKYFVKVKKIQENEETAE